MKNMKKILGMLLFVLTISLMSNVKADYYRIKDIKSDDELLTHSYVCQGEDVYCTYYPVPEVIPDENSEPTGEANIYLNEWYGAYTTEARNFSMVLYGEADASKNYRITLTSQYMNFQNDYTGEEINNGIEFTIGQTFGIVTVTVTEIESNANVSYKKFNNDCYLPDDPDKAEVDSEIEEFDTVYLYFNIGKTEENQTNPGTNPGTDPNPYPPYVQPEEDPEEKTKMQAVIDALTPNGKLKLDTVDPKTTEANPYLYDSLTTAAFMKKYDVGKYNVFVTPETEYVEHAYVSLSYYDPANNKYTSYSKDVDIEYAEKDNSISNKLTEIRTKLNHDYNYYNKSYDNSFNIDDLESINYYYNTQKIERDASVYLMPSYSSEIHALTDNVGFDFMFDPRAGGSMSMFYEPIVGPINILYNGIVVDNIDPIGFTLSNIIYIPDNTEKSRGAYIKAAENRIKEYLPGKNITITYEGDISELYEEEYSWSIYNEQTDDYDLVPIFDLDKTNGEFYVVQIGEAMYPYFIVADSSKMKNPVTKSVDMNTNVKVESDSSDVPLDARLNVKKLDKNSKEFQELAEKIKIIDDNSYDISVLSTSLGIYIENLENGNFRVYIPVKEELTKLNLVAAFVKDDDTVEEHEITFEGNYAVFETDHFSTYSLVEKETEEKEEVTYTADLDNIKLQFTDEEGHEFTVAIVDILSLSKEELDKIVSEKEYNETMDTLNKNLKDEGKILGIYVIEVEDEDGVAKTEGTFKIKIKLTDDLKKYNSFKLVNVDEENGYAKGDVVKLTVEGDYLVGELPHLSVYVLVGEEKEETKTETKTTNPATGDQVMKYGALLGISVLGIAGLTIYTRKTKKNK